MSTFDKIFGTFKSLILVETEIQRLNEDFKLLDARERETRERVVYLEGVVAGARARATQGKLPSR